MPFRSLRLRSVLALVGFFAVGCPTTMPSEDTGSGVDTGNSDAGIATDTGLRGDTGAGVDSGTADAGMPATPLASAYRGADRADCVCQALSEYATPDVCASVTFGSVVGDPCYDMAAAAAGGSAATWLDCTREVDTAYASCLSGPSGCDAADTCLETRDAAVTACGAEPDLTAYGTALDACLVTRVVGTGADTCSDTAMPSSMVGSGVFTGSTLGRGRHRMNISCLKGDGGAGVTHRWVAPAAGEYQFDTSGSEFDTVLFIADGCAPEATELACSDDDLGDSVLSSTSFAATAGQSVQVTVLGFSSGDAGNYRINITAL